jgi:hypothetical protein
VEIQALSATARQPARDQGVDTLIELLAAVDGLLAQQVELDLTTWEGITGRTLSKTERERAAADQHAASRWTFISSGLEHRVFRRIVADVSPAGERKLEAVAKKFAS